MVRLPTGRLLPEDGSDERGEHESSSSEVQPGTPAAYLSEPRVTGKVEPAPVVAGAEQIRH
jgi:hypothetical protein